MSGQLHVLASNARRGAETFAMALVGELQARGREAGAVALQQRTEARSAFDVEVLPGRRPRSPATLLALRRRAAAADVVVAHGSDTLMACALGMATVRTPFVYRMIGDPRYWSAAPLSRWRVRWALRRASRVVVLSPMFTDVLHNLHGVPRERIVVIPNAVDPERFPLVTPAARRAARDALGLPDDSSIRIVAFVGALVTEKDPLAAVGAALAVPDVHIVVAGEGGLGPSLPRDERVHLVGGLADVRPVYAAADVVVISSRSEGLPAVAIEAGMSGVPIVARDVGAVRDVVVPGTTGVLVAQGTFDALVEGLLDLFDGTSIGGPTGRAYCMDRFGINTVTDAWEGLLDDVCRARGG